METHVDRPEAPKSKTASKAVGKDDLQTLPLAEVEKKLGFVAGWPYKPRRKSG
jgi:hypothetical protein